MRAFSSCGEWGPLFIAVHGPLSTAAPPVAGHRLQTRRLSNCGSRAQSLRGMWDLPRPGLEPVSPALSGRFSTTAPPWKPDPAHLITFCLVVQKVEKLRPERWPDLPKVLQGVSGRARIESRSPKLHLAPICVEPARDVTSPAKKACVYITSCQLCRASRPLSQLVLSELARAGGTAPSISQMRRLRKKERLRGSLSQ